MLSFVLNIQLLTGHFSLISPKYRNVFPNSRVFQLFLYFVFQFFGIFLAHRILFSILDYFFQAVTVKDNKRSLSIQSGKIHIEIHSSRNTFIYWKHAAKLSKLNKQSFALTVFLASSRVYIRLASLDCSKFKCKSAVKSTNQSN